MKKLRNIVDLKVNRDVFNSRQTGFDRWKNFILEVDLIAKADVFYSKVICSHIHRNLFIQWRNLFWQIQS